jgi:hypothetical protein
VTSANRQSAGEGDLKTVPFSPLAVPDIMCLLKVGAVKCPEKTVSGSSRIGCPTKGGRWQALDRNSAILERVNPLQTT